jgi:glycosyltransferase involved in cell wall biosynthesis
VSSPNSEFAFVSVVIPCRNEVKAIEGTVRALLASTGVRVEVLVVDGMSEDGTRDIVKKLMLEDPRVRLVDNEKKKTPFAFNLGIVHSRGDFVQIVGARNELQPDYIQILVASLNANPRVACVGGDYQHVWDSESGRYVALAMESKFGVGGSNYRTMQNDCDVDTVGIPLYRKLIFNEIGLFDESLTRNQDDEFNFRVRQKGYLIRYIHSAKATYLVRGSLQKTFRQFFQYGYFKVFVNMKHKSVTTLRQLAPAVFLLGLFGSIVLTAVLPAVGWLLFVGLTCYVTLGLKLAGNNLSFLERLKVLRACFVLHVGYGLGYWQGLLDFVWLGRITPRERHQQQTT